MMTSAIKPMLSPVTTSGSDRLARIVKRVRFSARGKKRDSVRGYPSFLSLISSESPTMGAYLGKPPVTENLGTDGTFPISGTSKVTSRLSPSFTGSQTAHPGLVSIVPHKTRHSLMARTKRRRSGCTLLLPQGVSVPYVIGILLSVSVALFARWV